MVSLGKLCTRALVLFAFFPQSVPAYLELRPHIASHRKFGLISAASLAILPQLLPAPAYGVSRPSSFVGKTSMRKIGIGASFALLAFFPQLVPAPFALIAIFIEELIEAIVDVAVTLAEDGIEKAMETAIQKGAQLAYRAGEIVQETKDAVRPLINAGKDIKKAYDAGKKINDLENQLGPNNQEPPQPAAPTPAAATPAAATRRSLLGGGRSLAMRKTKFSRLGKRGGGPKAPYPKLAIPPNTQGASDTPPAPTTSKPDPNDSLDSAQGTLYSFSPIM